MSSAMFIPEAGIDPYPLAQQLISARPQEVHALADGFSLAAEELQTSGGLGGLAAELADSSACFDGQHPTELLSEIVAVQESLSAQPAQLQMIGSSLQALAMSLSASQLVLQQLLDAMEMTCVVLAAQVTALAPGAETEPERQSLMQAGAKAVLDCYNGVLQQHQKHDQVADSVLAALQSAGYILPVDIDAGIESIGFGVPDSAMQAGAEGVAAWWAGLTDSEQALLIQNHPEQLAALSGLPSSVYDIVNRRQLATDQILFVPDLPKSYNALVESGALYPGVLQLVGLSKPSDLLDASDDQIVSLGMFLLPSGRPYLWTFLEDLRNSRKINRTQSSLTPGADGRHRYLLEYDLDRYDDSFGGNGTAVIAIGEVETADNVAVMVPGAENDLCDIQSQTTDGGEVLELMDEMAPDAEQAMIIYEGYDNPTLVQAISPSRAFEGGQALLNDLKGWEAARGAAGSDDAHVTVIGHSYGTTTTAYALTAGASEIVDDVVLLGSPGVGIGNNHVTDLGLSGDHVFAGFDDDDLLRWPDRLEDLVGGQVVLGPEPHDLGFGAKVLSTWGTDGHGDYFGYEDGKPVDTLYSSAAVAVAEYDEVKLD